MTESWWKKHRPEELDDIYGNNKALKNIRQWAEGFIPGDEPLLFEGEQGTGKTSTAEAVANEMGWNFVEINASTATRKEDIESIAAEMQMKSSDGSYTLFLLDEADALSDSSNLTKLKRIFENPPNPIILTANEAWKIPNSITNKCNEFSFSVGKRTKKSFIKDIAEKEDMDLSSKEIGILATRDDLRSIINDMQEISEKEGDIDWDNREIDIGEFEAVGNIIAGKKYTGEVSPPDLVQWLNQNFPKRVEGVEAMRIMQALAEADKFLGRAERTQNYSWWKYAGEIAEQTANMRITEPYDGYWRKEYPQIRKQSNRNPNGDSAEAVLYRKLKRYDRHETEIFTKYSEFLDIVLPILREKDEKTKFELINRYDIPEKCYSLLDVSKSDYDDWVMFTDVEEDEDDESDTNDDSNSIYDY